MGNKKKLLEENTVRSFMKLANLDVGLSSNFLRENYEDPEDPEGSDEEVDMDMSGDQGDMDMGMEDPEADAPVDPALQDAIEGAIKDFIEGGAQRTGVDVTVKEPGDEDGDEEFPEDEEFPGDEGPLDPMADMPDDMEGGEVLDEINVIDTDAVVQETMRRVTKRLTAMNREEKLVERLASKIQAKLNRK